MGAPSKRWVHTNSSLPGLEGTPAERIQYVNYSACAYSDYRCAAIAHYSLFDAFHRSHLRVSCLDPGLCSSYRIRCCK